MWRLALGSKVSSVFLQLFFQTSAECLLCASHWEAPHMETVSSLCTESLELAQWTGVTVGGWDTCPRGCCGTGTACEQDSTRDPGREDALGSLWEPCTGLLSCPILADGLERTGATPYTFVLWQVDTDRDVGPWGCVARAKAAWLPRSLGKVELPPAHTRSLLCWRHVLT